MFGLGRKKDVDKSPNLTPGRVDRYFEICRNFPGIVPRSGAKVSDLAVSIAKTITVSFNDVVFEDALLTRHSIEREFKAGWSRTDARSRWFSLGFICLTYCSLKSTWSEALTESVGNQVYDAAVEFLWLRSEVPDEVKKNVVLFMRANIQNITSSLNNDFEEIRPLWFNRYAARLKGFSPPWTFQTHHAPKWDERVGWRSLFGVEAGEDNFPIDIELSFTLNKLFQIASETTLNLLKQSDPSGALTALLAQEPQKAPIERTVPPATDRGSSPLLTVPDQDRMKRLWEGWEQGGAEGIGKIWEEEAPQ